MRSHVPSYELVAPAKLSDALALLASGEWRPFAGGTDLMVLLEAGKLEHRRWVSILHLSELKGIAETPEHVTLGALTTYSEVLASGMPIMWIQKLNGSRCRSSQLPPARRAKRSRARRMGKRLEVSGSTVMREI